MKKNLGFTLIEILVVISIISLLSSVVLSAMQDARYKAQAAAYRQYLNELSKAIELCYLTEENYPPDETTISTFISTYSCISDKISYQAQPIVFNQVGQYVGNPHNAGSKFSCGNTIALAGKEHYLLYTASNKELNLPILYLNDIPANPMGGAYYYCVSPSAH